MSFKKDIETVKKQVEYLLETYPETRNNDFYLVILWAKFYGGLREHIGFIPFDLIKENSGKPTTINRVRQFIQNHEKRFPPTDPLVMRKRKQKQEDYRLWFGQRSDSN